MMLPDIFTDSFFNDFMSDPWDEKFFRVPASRAASMKTDVKETADQYELEVELPGFKKEDVQAELKNGYLTIRASKNENTDEKDSEGRYIRRERYRGSCERSFFVGKDLTQQDVQAKFENGILKLSIPKEVPKKVEEKKYISIE